MKLSASLFLAAATAFTTSVQGQGVSLSKNRELCTGPLCNPVGDPLVFEIGCEFDGVGSGSYNIGDGEENVLTLSYVDHGVDTIIQFTDCSTSGVTLDVTNAPGSVSFSNVGDVVEETLCVDVAMILDPSEIPLATRQCKVKILADGSGVAEADTGVDATIEVNSQVAYMPADGSEEREATFTVICTSPIQFQQEAEVVITGDAPANGWNWAITAINPSCGTLTITENNSGPTGSANAFFTLDDPNCYTGAVTIEVIASWSIPTRRLRALQDGGQQSGEISESFSVDVDSSSVPPELLATDSAASGMTLSFSTTMMAAAGGLAALAI